MAEQIFPTKGNLIACKKNLTLAKLGFDLLDRKRNVLMREMMKLIDEAAGMQRAIGDTFIKAYKSAGERQYHAGHRACPGGRRSRGKRLSVTGHSIMGVDLPTGHLAQPASVPPTTASPAAMPSSTTPMSASIKSNSSARSSQALKTAFTGWPWPSKTHSARANMLENVVIPRLEGNIKLFPARWKSMNAKNSRV